MTKTSSMNFFEALKYKSKALINLKLSGHLNFFIEYNFIIFLSINGRQRRNTDTCVKIEMLVIYNFHPKLSCLLPDPNP